MTISLGSSSKNMSITKNIFSYLSRLDLNVIYVDVLQNAVKKTLKHVATFDLAGSNVVSNF